MDHAIKASFVIAISLFVPAFARADQLFTCNDNASGCLAVNQNGSGIAIDAAANGGIGMAGNSVSNDGVHGASQQANGVSGMTLSQFASGVYGENDANGYGVAGRAPNSGIAVLGDNPSASGWSGFFTGNVFVSGSVSHSSDRRLKQDIAPIRDSLDRTLQLHGVTFHWKDGQRGSGLQMGFIAQDVEKVFPEWVTTDPQGFKAINTGGLDALLVESVRALRAENEELNARLRVLETAQAKRTNLLGGFADGAYSLAALVLFLGGGVLFWRRRAVGS